MGFAKAMSPLGSASHSAARTRIRGTGRDEGRSSGSSDQYSVLYNTCYIVTHWLCYDMPRGPRLDAPGALHHVIARGIDRGALFTDDGDRADFLDRLAALLACSGTRLYAWALIPNHFHLLLRTGTAPLSSVLRRLLTGYAVRFNRRHHRVGHLFQNRFKSILVEDDPYLLALVRYIHLNPLRARLVESLEQLDLYPWSGHGVLLGHCRFPAQDCAAVLRQFHAHAPSEARARYRRFVAAAVGRAEVVDLSGGGLRRSLVWRGVRNLARGRERWTFDERVLGSGPFVETLLAELPAPDAPLAVTNPLPLVARLCAEQARHFKISIAEICGRSLRRRAQLARAAVCREAVVRHGLRPTIVARLLGISLQSVLRATLPQPAAARPAKGDPAPPQAQ